LTVTVRPLAPADLGPVGDIFGWYAVNSVATFEEAPRSAADWAALAAELSGLGLPFLVADDGGRIAGYAYAATVENSIFIAPGHTGHGIGRFLLAELLTACAAAGARQVIAVIADSGSAASVGLHESFGFAHVGRLTDVGFKHGSWISTLLMQRAIS